MTAHAIAAEPSATRTLPLPTLAQGDVEAARLLRDHALPPGLGREIGRAAHEVIEQLVAPALRPAVELVSDGQSFRLEADALSLDDSSGLGFELARGRTSVRVAPTGDTTVSRNGWRLATGRPVAVRDGDVVLSGCQSFVVRYEPPLPAPFVEIGPARHTARPARSGFEFRFAIEPFGEPIVLRCDRASGRAVLDLVLRGGGSRPFDPTAIGHVDRAVIAWVVHRFVDRVGRGLFDASAAVRPAPDLDLEPELWFAAAVRIASYCGVWWFGVRASGIGAVSTLLAPQTRASRASHAALRRIEVWLTARATLGRITFDELAALEPGDLFVARCAGARGGGFRVDGGLAVLGAGCDPVPAELEVDERSVRARLVGPTVKPRREEERGHMDEHVDPNSNDLPFEPVLDGIGVVVGVEVARRRMTLGELLALAPGAIVEMDAPIHNAVTLLIDGSPFARGELVDADGRLGVRVLALGGKR